MHHENAPVRPSLKTLHRQLEVELFLKANFICAVIFVCVLLACEQALHLGFTQYLFWARSEAYHPV